MCSINITTLPRRAEVHSPPYIPVPTIMTRLRCIPRPLPKVGLSAVEKKRSPSILPQKKPLAIAEDNVAKMKGIETKSGTLFTTRTDPSGRTHKIRVRVEVYTSTYDHYAVVYPDKICRACGFINLKNCTLEAVTGPSCGFKVIPKDCEGTTVTFLVSSPTELEEWMEACTNQDTSSKSEYPSGLSRSPTLSPHSPLMPTLEEDEELAEEEEETEE